LAEQAVTMNAEQIGVFRKYVALGPQRTLEALFAQLEAEPNNAITFRMLRRWSSKHSWHDRARESDGEVKDAVEDIQRVVVKSMVQEQLDALHVIQERFIQRLETIGQEAGLREPDYEDFHQAIRAEKMILGDSTQAKDIVPQKSRILLEMDEETLRALALESIRLKAGLPSVTVLSTEDREALPSGDSE